jgi:hypothetical protein
MFRTLIIATTTAATLFSSVAFTQKASQGTTSVPDFSGMWAYPYWPSFELPLSGPGPVVNKLRQRQLLDADGRRLPAANAPLAGNPLRLVGDYANPILKLEAAEIVRKQGELELNGGAPTPSNQCWPSPGPYIFRSVGMQMFQKPDTITILYYTDHQVRHVRMNQPHPARVTPSWYGDSVGHYEGDTLVIDTVGIKTDRPFAMLDMYGTPYTRALHMVERYRLIDYEAAKEAQERNGKENWRFDAAVAEGWVPDPSYKGKGLQLQFTIEDEGVFTTSWSATITYRRPSLTEWGEQVCAENIHEYYAGRDTAVPRSDKPDF